MNQDREYRVTRSGREVYVGSSDGLLEAAREGLILANDLIFDPELERWVFARSLKLLAAFALKGRRRSPGEEGVDETIRFDETKLKRRTARRRTLAQLLAALLMLATAGVLILWIPTNSEKSRSSGMSKFAMDDDGPQVRYEGTGPGVDGPTQTRRGPSNLDGKPVTIEGIDGQGKEEKSFGRRAVIIGGADEPALGDKAGAAGANAQAGQEKKSEQSGGSDSAAKQDSGGEGSERSTEPAKPRPVDLAPMTEPAVRIVAKGALSDESVERSLDAAKRALSAAEDLSSDLDLIQLLEHRLELEYLESNFRKNEGKSDRVKELGGLIDELRETFTALCNALHSTGYCGLKSQHPTWPDVVIRSALEGEALVGMSLAQLAVAWSEPADIRKERRGRKYCRDQACSKWVRVLAGLVVEMSP